jgi:hypothetical protein
MNTTLCKPLPPNDTMTDGDPVRAAPGVLVRSALASFDSIFNVSSPRWETLLDSYLGLVKQFESEQALVLALLYEAIPTSDPLAKRVMIKAKRDVYNKRPATLPEGIAAPEEIIERLSAYNSLLADTQADLAREGAPMMHELRLKLSRLLDNELFAAAVSYSCPWLPSQLRKNIERPTCQFSNAERGLYGYAVKTFAKANPFYVFAGVGIQDPSDEFPEVGCEVILDTSLLLALEARLVGSYPAAIGPYLALCSCAQMDGYIKFLVATDTTFKILSLRRAPFIDGLLRYFRDNSRVHTLLGALEYLVDSGVVPCGQRENAERDLHALAKLSIITSYWFRDFDHLRQDCPNNSHPDYEIVNRLATIHLSMISITSVPRLHAEMASLGDLSACEPMSANSYYLNSYSKNLPDPTVLISDTIRKDLEEIRSLFVVTNFSYESAAIEFWLEEQLRKAPHQRLRLVDLVEPFLRWSQGVAPRDAPTFRGHAAGRGALSSVIEAFSSYGGAISRAQLLQLDKALDKCNPSRYRPSDLCVNGTYDTHGARFYLSNALVGYRRYVSRFRRLHDVPGIPELENGDGVLDAQLVVPLKHNRDYGVAVWRTGTGFHTRERHRFADWLNLADLVIESRHDQLRYVDSRSGRVIRLHFCGYLLANYLPEIYKLLLVGHGDFCYIPGGPIPYKAVIRDGPYQQGLFYGSICLRRPQWHIERRSFEKVLAEPNIFKATAELSIGLEAETHTGICEWYFRTVAPGKMSSKPRLLQSRNPLSVQAFRREVSRLPADGMVTLSAMEPSPECLRSSGGSPTVSEVLIKL